MALQKDWNTGRKEPALMEAYLRKHWAQANAEVVCRFYRTEARDQRKLLQLTVAGIELWDDKQDAAQTVDLIPWSAVLGASESTASVRRRFVPSYRGDEVEEDQELVVFGCLPKSEMPQRAGVMGGLVALAGTMVSSLLPMTRSRGPDTGTDGCERVTVQWVFRFVGKDAAAVALRTVKAIRFLADPRVQQVDKDSVKEAQKALDAYGVMPPRHFMVVINPAGGAGNAQSTYEQTVAPVLEQANVDVETVITTHAGHATELLADLPLDKFDCVVAVGGDGLLSEMLQGLMKRKDWQKAILQPLGVVPGGSGNGLSAALLARAGEHNEALNAAYSLAKGSTQELDLFSVSNSQDEAMYGFLSLEWAFVANMDIASERFRYFGDSRFLIATVLQIFGLGRKSFPGRLRYLVSDEDEPLPEKYHERISSDSAGARPRCVCLEQDRQAQEEGEKAVTEKTGTWKEMDGPFYMFWGMNVSHAAADAHIAPPAAIDDGYFYMMLVSGPDFSRVGLSRLMMGIEDGSHLDVDRVQLVRTRAFTLSASADDDLMCVDGEVFPGPEVKLEVHRGLGRVLSLPTRR